MTAFPEIRAFERHADDEFVVLACDGIWDVMSSQQVVSKVSDMLQNGRPPPPPPPPADEDAARAVVRQAYALGSTDNMTAVVVHLAAGAVAAAE